MRVLTVDEAEGLKAGDEFWLTKSWKDRDIRAPYRCTSVRRRYGRLVIRGRRGNEYILVQESAIWSGRVAVEEKADPEEEDLE